MAVTQTNGTSGHTLYEGSTQFQHWRFSKEELHSKRFELNQSAITKIRNTFEADEPGSSASVEFLSPDDELALVKHYLTKIGALCAYFRFPEIVESTAVSFLKRFYLKNTVMDYHPKNVMLTTLFLAAKATNNPIGIDRYASAIPNTKPTDVLDLEFLVAQSLRFEFTVWPAQRSLWGIWLDIQDLQEFEPATSQEAYESALDLVRKSRLTDVELIYTPSQIAIACFQAAAPEMTEKWLQSKFPDSSDKGYQAATSAIAEVRGTIDGESQETSVEVVRAIDKRLKICTNPEKVVGSKAYKAKESRIEQEAASNRVKKAEEVKAAMEDNPFGAELDITKQHGVPGAPTFNQQEALENPELSVVGGSTSNSVG